MYCVTSPQCVLSFRRRSDGVRQKSDGVRQRKDGFRQRPGGVRHQLESSVGC